MKERAQTAEKLVWRIEDVKAAIGISSATTIGTWVKERNFPAPKKLGHHLAWKPEEVVAWVDAEMSKPFVRSFSPKLGK